VSLDATAEDEEEDETEEYEAAGHNPAADAVEEGLRLADSAAVTIGVTCFVYCACHQEVQMVELDKSLIDRHDELQLGEWEMWKIDV